MSENEVLTIQWFGRCCFLIKYQQKKVVFDPYDTFCNVDIGKVDADILISSSTWHDHGHIGASPNAHIVTYPGSDNVKGIEIYGIETKEERGTPTVVFNVKLGPYSITNFADLGASYKNELKNSLTNIEKDILESTNIAFIRPSIIEEVIGATNTHNEIALEFCSPAIIFPEHYFPRSFTDKQVSEDKKADFYLPVRIVNEMMSIFNYPCEEINDYQIQINPLDLRSKKFIKFLQIHPQVKYFT
jgi:hypothetical protein